ITAARGGPVCPRSRRGTRRRATVGESTSSGPQSGGRCARQTPRQRSRLQPRGRPPLPHRGGRDGTRLGGRMSTHSSHSRTAQRGRPPSGSANTPIPGLRTTKQRTAVVAVLNDNDEFRSAQEIHEQLRDQGESIGLATVYRTLQSLSDAAEIDM